ncbi:MAG: helix-hairpin-helix domain-containing protein [Candidatus Omnitrophota bacterium]
MKLTIYEKYVFLILAGSLLLGAIIFHARAVSVFPEIVIERNGIKEEHTLEEVDKFLKERARVNINTSRVDELCLIPGVGEKLAKQIIDYRQSKGNYFKKEELLNVKGIGSKKFEKLKEFIKIE